MRRSIFLAASLAGSLLIGCSSHQDQPPQTADDAVHSGPITPETRFAAGQLAESQDKLPTAITQYQEALKLNPHHLGSLYRLAVVYAELKQYPKSEETWQQYVDATGKDATAYGDLGFCHELAGETALAKQDYLAGIDRDPKCVPCRVNYGLMLARAGQFDDAISQWKFVLTDAEIHYNLGSVYAQKGRKEQARVEFRKALELDPALTDAKVRVSELDQQ